MTYSDTGLLANSSYSYRVRAVDAAGNVSGYSTVVSGTTAGSGSGYGISSYGIAPYGS